MLCLVLLLASCGAGETTGSLQQEARKQRDPAGEALRERAREKGLKSLAQVPVLDSPNLPRYVADRSALLVLGKALFWDQQLGSDGMACASCHFHAGADNRSRNQLNPGLKAGDRSFQAGFGPNYQLSAGDFPIMTNDVVSSSGVFDARFVPGAWMKEPGGVFGLPDYGVSYTSGFADIFHVDGFLVRNVEPRNTPPTINGVFNLRNFWDGRARSEFNAVNPFGDLDSGATIVRMLPNGTPVVERVKIPFSSLLSQANGPPLSDLEMSFAERLFADAGRKLVDSATIPLGRQTIVPSDSVFGASGKKAWGNIQLPGGYAALIKKAFRSEFWDDQGWAVQVNDYEPTPVRKEATLGANEYTLLEWNFSLFFGAAVGAYEQTLISSRTKFDRFMEGDLSALSGDERLGLEVFLDKGKCVNCHGGAEFTNASISHALPEPIERMKMGNGRVAVYDNGFYNIGVRPTAEDVGLGGTAPSGAPLSDALRYQNCVKASAGSGATPEAIAQANVTCSVPSLYAQPEEARAILEDAHEASGPVAGVADLLDGAKADLEAGLRAAAFEKLELAYAALVASGPLPGSNAENLLSDARLLLPHPDPEQRGSDPSYPLGLPLQPHERVTHMGAFKTPGLRNVELTAPYFHNGGKLTLEQVVEFYDDGGDFADENREDLDPDITALSLSQAEIDAVVAFLKALTDERVRYDRAPFDHPSLMVPDGAEDVGSWQPLFLNQQVLLERWIEVPACGAAGYTSPRDNFLDL